MKRPATTALVSNSLKETADFGREFACCLQGGDVIALTGGLGSGKTTLVKSIARHLGIKTRITSPTFALIASFAAKKQGVSRLFHIDCYRVRRLAESDRAAIMEAIETPRAVTLIEWANLFPSLLARIPPRRLTTVSLTVLNQHSRSLTISGALRRSAQRWGRGRPS